ncbi:peptidoglycan-binding protein LysM [Glaciimonas soli]|uniref:Peptidoglycan-binding protein LysM n=1 Tax=Glaciimonas soli TaxID=2590999 RepID=A0A843YVG8_9BURK|nr:peptidoglycan-binding protein LysM [Glaciimonas soli]MQR01987.1 peptidoglycan-binding protein LysM [Glaciimonas soli]
MGILNFSGIGSAISKAFGIGEAKAAATTAAPNLQDLEQKAADAITANIAANNLTADGLLVAFDAKSSTVTVQGEAADQATKEKILLCCGNVHGVTVVTDEMSVTAPSDPSEYYTVVSGDNLSKIAAHYYGNANDYPKIVDANQPMIVNADKIYPGQSLRIPPKTW